MDSQRYNRIKEIFLKASALNQKNRDKYLSAICANDMELRHDIEVMLKYDDSDLTIVEIDPTPSYGKQKKIAHTLTSLFASKLFGTKIRARILVIITVTFVVLLGYWTHYTIESILLDKIALDLHIVKDGSVSNLNIWIENHKKDVEKMANDPLIIKFVEEILEINETNPDQFSAIIQSSALKNLRQRINPFWHNFTIGTREGVYLAQRGNSSIGQRTSEKGHKYLLKVLDGRTIMTHPVFVGSEYTHGSKIDKQKPSPFLSFLAPVRNKNNRIIAAIEKSLDGQEFSKLMKVGFFGKTGETNLFESDGKVISESRYLDKLKMSGLIPNDSTFFTAIGSYYLRDPGGDLLAGFKPDNSSVSWPLTTLGASVIAHRENSPDEYGEGVILKPYRNHLGRMVIGIWCWLPEYELGVASEIEENEAFEVLRYIELTFFLIFVVLGISVLINIFSTTHFVRMQRKVKLGQKLGQYTIIKSLGEGGLGQVYLARHAMLKRPTAIKILKSEMISTEMNKRFEMEVQAASHLSHPNTIEIYDYGQTSQGVFYYVMEYIEGPTLRDLVKKEGAVILPRVVHILKKISASLNEAHKEGLVHRDIKPLNIMLCKRGGQYDVVKVLDFGLVKNISDPEMTKLTKPFTFAGTALYTAPERIRNSQDADTRSDIYSLGAVGYYLITGQHIFDSSEEMDILYKVVNEDPRPIPDEIIDNSSPEFIKLIMDCLAKDPADRPQTIAEVQQILSSVSIESEWTSEDARFWWEQYLNQK